MFRAVSRGFVLQVIMVGGLSIRSGEITKQNAHKHVPALDLQSLMNIFGFNEKKRLNYTRAEPRLLGQNQIYIFTH